MKNLFNRTFFHFALGFLSILIVSFALAAVVTHLDTTNNLSASTATQGE